MFGAEILTRLALHGDAPLPRWIDAAKMLHAYAQVFGFAGLFVMGVALHAMPRFKSGELVRPGLMPVALWLQIAGVSVVVVGVLVGGFVAAAARVIGAAALLGTALAFGRMMRDTLRAGGPPSESVASAIELGGQWAHDRGAPWVAADLYEAAAARTPSRRVGSIGRRRREAARDLSMAGDQEHVVVCMDDVKRRRFIGLPGDRCEAHCSGE